MTLKIIHFNRTKSRILIGAVNKTTDCNACNNLQRDTHVSFANTSKLIFKLGYKCAHAHTFFSLTSASAIFSFLPLNDIQFPITKYFAFYILMYNLKHYLESLATVQLISGFSILHLVPNNRQNLTHTHTHSRTKSQSLNSTMHYYDK